MKMFLSGLCNDDVDSHLMTRMYSYHYFKPKKDQTAHKTISAAFSRGAKVFLDSGAYSAFTTGKQIDFNAYRDHCLRYKDEYLHVAALDVIGDPDASYKNFQEQKKDSVPLVPVFHFNEPFDLLQTLVAESNIVALGGVAQLCGATGRMREWLDSCWDILADSNGVPRIKVHGFAMGIPSLVSAYPWYSVDSASWARAATFGLLNWISHGFMSQIAVTESKQFDPKIKVKHFAHSSEDEQRVILNLCKEYGISFDDCVVSEHARKYFNSFAFIQLEKLAPIKLAARQEFLFE